MQQKYWKMFSFKLKRRIRLSKKAQNAFFFIANITSICKTIKNSIKNKIKS